MKDLKNFDLSYFFLKDGDNVLKEFGTYEAEFFLIEKSLFEYYKETKNIMFLWQYAFIVLFNTYESPIIANPTNPDNPLTDMLFTYANSFLYVELWLIEKTREKELNKINEIWDYLNNRLDYWKEQDSNNTYCDLTDTHSCSGEDCTMHGTSYCTLHHYISAWDSFKSEMNDKKTELINSTNDYFDWLRDNTKQLFILRLYWSFLLCQFWVKLPALAIKEPNKKENKKKINNIDIVLLEIYKRRHKHKDTIKFGIMDLLGVSENAINLYFYKLKKRGLIDYNRNSDKIIIKKAGLNKIKWLLGGINES